MGEERGEHSGRSRMDRGRGSVKGWVRKRIRPGLWEEKEMMHQVLYAKVVQLECSSMKIEIILWNEICCLVSERKGGGSGCERGCLGHEYRSIEVLGGNWRGYSLTTSGQYKSTAAIKSGDKSYLRGLGFIER